VLDEAAGVCGAGRSNVGAAWQDWGKLGKQRGGGSGAACCIAGGGRASGAMGASGFAAPHGGCRRECVHIRNLGIDCAVATASSGESLNIQRTRHAVSACEKRSVSKWGAGLGSAPITTRLVMVMVQWEEGALCCRGASGGVVTLIAARWRVENATGYWPDGRGDRRYG